MSDRVEHFEITRPKIERVEEVFQSDNEYIKMFYKELSNLDTEIPLFYKNLSTLTFEKDDTLYSRRKSSSYYDALTNNIVTNSKEMDQQLSHELLHMSSSIVEGDTIHVGFYQANGKDGYQIGEALNEGFTNSLDYRLFKDIIPGKDKTKIDIYPITTKISEDLESTLETKRMLDCYFKADLKTIYNYLSRLMGKDKSLIFLYSYDALLHCSDDCSRFRPIMLHLLYPDIQIFVVEAFYTKITDCYRAGTLDRNSYKAYLELVKIMLLEKVTIMGIPLTPKLKEAYPYIEKRYDGKYKIREKNNCLVK